MSIDDFLYHLELSHFYQAIDDQTKAKRECLDGIKCLNSFSKGVTSKVSPRPPPGTTKTPTHTTTQIPPERLKLLSQYALNHYNNLSKPLSITEKLDWMCSRFSKAEIFPPVIEFSPDWTSHHTNFMDLDLPTPYQDQNKSIGKLPYEAEFRPVDIDDWSNQYEDLTSLYQDMLSNCSFVSSILAIVDSSSQFSLINMISPHTSNSKYKVILHFNGLPRIVTIDNRLPFLIGSNEDRNVFIKSFTDPQLYWPALIEKAYLKVMGDGYVFNGSNMANDTYMLTGWIPEIIKLQNGKLPNEFRWLWKYKQDGEIILGIGTGKISKKLSTHLKLISEHDYVIDRYNMAGNNLTLKNPWISNSLIDRFISINDLTCFRYLYVNWKPSNLFKYSYRQSFIYRVKDDCIFTHPQFTLKNNTIKEQEVWLLLERHLESSEQQPQGWINVGIFETSSKVLTPTQFRNINLSEETNNRLHLIKVKTQPRGSYTAVVSSNKNCNFTLTMFNNISSDFTFSKSKYLYNYTLPAIEGEWAEGSNGGNWSMSTYINNPQYDLIVKEPSKLIAVLYGEQEMQVNFHLFHSEKSRIGKKIHSFDKSKLLNNENYNSRFQLNNYNLMPGCYKLVVSGYDRSKGKFVLLLNSSSQLTIEKIPQNIGLFIRKKEFNWENTNRYKLYFELTTYRTRLSFHINHFNNSDKDYEILTNYRPAIRASIFDANTSMPIQINEKFDDSLYGVFIEAEIERVGTYILLIERFEIGLGRCVIEVGSNYRIELK
ncbi:RIM13 [[Candida] subhashii]|uniref:RIM13 n=1 Tax=[Candida] subhashii TaxID=561895 RepID=A0A8J5UDE9_9ASCO|nr:RIM13 [[Candida] subhashii]KAG7660333.1 RIM13 [[Candida] subhashii]